MNFVGVDYGSKLAGTTVIAFAKNETIHFVQSKKKADADAFLSDWLLAYEVKQVFIDAPLSLPDVYQRPNPSGDFFYRKGDRELKAMSPMFLGGLTARAMRLSAKIQAQSAIEFRETYPGYLARLLALPSEAYKKEKVQIPVLTSTLCNRFSLVINKMPTNWHQFDALLAYISGLRFQRGDHKTFGDPEEGQIVV